MLAEVCNAVDSVELFVHAMDMGLIQGIPAATRDSDGTWLTEYALEWKGRFLQDRATFSGLGVPRGASLIVHLLVLHHDSLVTRPPPHRRVDLTSPPW